MRGAEVGVDCLEAQSRSFCIYSVPRSVYAMLGAQEECRPRTDRLSRSGGLALMMPIANANLTCANSSAAMFNCFGDGDDDGEHAEDSSKAAGIGV
jgi:hypothetical protein